MTNALDEALTRLQASHCELINGLSNHAPMVAEALHHLGLDEDIKAWLDSDAPRWTPMPAAEQPVDASTWQDALGKMDRYGDWCVLFEHYAEQHGWRDTLGTWVPRLAPGFASAAAHGVIRVGHAARALTELDAAVRRAELAHALASWTCTYQALPVGQGHALRLAPAQALAALPPLGTRVPQGSITAALGMLSDDIAFAEHFHALDIEDDLEQLTLDIAATFARLFCRSAHTPLQAIVFTHAITGTAAVRHLAPHLKHADHARLLQHAFHTGCALHRVYSEHDYQPPAAEALIPGLEESVYDALAHGDEHVIKLTEACVEFTRLTGDGFFLTAAERCRRLLPERK